MDEKNTVQTHAANTWSAIPVASSTFMPTPSWLTCKKKQTSHHKNWISLGLLTQMICTHLVKQVSHLIMRYFHGPSFFSGECVKGEQKAQLPPTVRVTLGMKGGAGTNFFCEGTSSLAESLMKLQNPANHQGWCKYPIML